jgi:hypothetical protein
MDLEKSHKSIETVVVLVIFARMNGYFISFAKLTEVILVFMDL